MEKEMEVKEIEDGEKRVVKAMAEQVHGPATTVTSVSLPWEMTKELADRAEEREVGWSAIVQTYVRIGLDAEKKMEAEK